MPDLGRIRGSASRQSSRRRPGSSEVLVHRAFAGVTSKEDWSYVIVGVNRQGSGRMKQEKPIDAESLGMGPVALPRRRRPLRHGHDGLGDPLQASRRLQHRHRPLHLLALPPLGDQAALEPLRRHVPDEAVLDRRDAAPDRGVFRLRRPHDPGARFRPLHPRLLLDHGLQLGHPRHRRRRLLHARPQGVPAGGLRRGADDLLPDRDDRRQGDPRRPGGDPGSSAASASSRPGR